MHEFIAKNGLIVNGNTNILGNITASGTISASSITASTFLGTSSVATTSLTASSLIAGNPYVINNLTSSNISANIYYGATFAYAQQSFTLASASGYTSGSWARLGYSTGSFNNVGGTIKIMGQPAVAAGITTLEFDYVTSVYSNYTDFLVRRSLRYATYQESISDVRIVTNGGSASLDILLSTNLTSSGEQLFLWVESIGSKPTGLAASTTPFNLYTSSILNPAVVGNVSYMDSTKLGFMTSADRQIMLGNNTSVIPNYSSVIGSGSYVAKNALDVLGNISCSVITSSVGLFNNISCSGVVTASSFTGITSSGYTATSSLATGSFNVIENNGTAFLYYRCNNGTLRSSSLS
jgi:hypothetical protein